MQKINIEAQVEAQVEPQTGLVDAAIASSSHPSLLGQQIQPSEGELRCFERCFRQDDPVYLKDHQIYQTVLVPAAAYLSMALLAGIETLGTHKLVLEDVVIYQALPIFTSSDSKLIHTALKVTDEAAYSFEISSENDSSQPEALWQLHASGTIQVRQPSTFSHLIELSNLSSTETAPDLAAYCEQPICSTKELSDPQFYQKMRACGFFYGPQFQAITRLCDRQTGILGEVQLPTHLATDAESQIVHPVLLDACLQVLGTQLPEIDTQDAYLPVGLDRMEIFDRLGSRLLVDLQKMYSRDEKGNCLSANINLITAEGKLIAQLEGVTFRKVSRRVLEWRLKKIQKRMKG